ncbi:putative RNA-binding protein 19 isoform X2 [Lycorma delicatula]|uniref:putative RNA-binding protein 19 isoform X2 n=1 Tax=Lycorma delicatula TaxID=130591 RepID=UPI003F50F3F6
MSRLIVKNLPNNITSEKLKDHFSQKGLVTDVQLKYTKDGKFRHFGFVGYQNEDDAKSALEYFNNTFIRSVKIEVQLCAELGGTDKPKSWSKYAPDSSAYKKIHQTEIEDNKKEKKKKEEKVKNKTEEMIIEKMKKHKDDPLFMEYLEAHGKDALTILEKVKKVEQDSGVEEEEEEEGDEDGHESIVDKEKTAADADISDMEYLRLKMKNSKKESVNVSDESETKGKEKIKFFTVKISGLPYTVSKSQLKEFFRQCHPSSIRLPRGKRGFGYVSFKTQKNMKLAFSKNKSFIGGKQILVKEYKGNENGDQEKTDIAERWRQQEEMLKEEENIGESGCIFVRNLSYTVTEDELKKLFGPLTEVNVPVDRLTRRVKGFGIVTFLMPEHAVQAYSQLDGTVFHGRMLHLLPGKTKDGSKSNDGDEEDEKTASYKKKKAKKQKETAGLSYNWNTLFLGQNAIADIIAQNYNTTKEKVMMGNDVAVRLALGETQIVSETRQFLEDNGVKLDAFNQAPNKRSKTVILVKNLPANTTVTEIRELFVKFGELGRVLLPPCGVTGIVEFLEPSEARAAFVKLAYTKFKHLPLYLEWAPDDTFNKNYESTGNSKEDKDKINEKDKINDHEEIKDNKDDDDDEFMEEPEPDTTLFVKNLNFSTDENSLKKHFLKCGKIASVNVGRKKDPSKPGVLLSMGYGFVQFYKKNSLNNALKSLQQSELDGHKLEIKRSNRTVNVNVAVEKKKSNVEKQTGTKILVRNIPFQATRNEISQLFQTFGELKAVRLPKKMVGTGLHRGFCFIDYVSKSDAKRAMKALCQSTHLYGRRLVLEWAQAEESVEELRKRTAENFLSSDDTTKLKKKKGTANIDVENEEYEEDIA